MRKLITVSVGLCLAASVAWANAPGLMNYQGNLVSSGGSPLTGTYDMTFSIYSTPSGGSPLWAETLSTVSVSGGLFSVVLGSVHPLTSTMFVSTDRWMGVRVNPDPELTPRLRMTSTPYALRTASIDSSTGGIINGATRVYRNAGGSVFLGNEVDPLGVELRDASGLLVANLSFFDGGGSVLSLRDNLGQARILASSDVPDIPQLELFSSFGPTVRLRAEAGDTRLQFFDNTSSDSLNLRIDQAMDFAGPELRMVDNIGDGQNNYVGLGMNQAHSYLQMIDNSGSGNSIQLNTEGIGDASTILPDNAINAGEMLNEPGIVSNTFAGVVTLDTLMKDLVTLSITIPSPGYIRLFGKVSELWLKGTTSSNLAFVQIDETFGGSVLPPYYGVYGSESFPTTDYSFYSPVVERIYFKPAGTYSFRLEGKMGSGFPAEGAAGYPTLTATYLPTSYGSVVTVAEGGTPSDIRATSAAQIGTTASGVRISNASLIDLREFELKAAKAQAEAERAQRELLEAQLRAQSASAESKH